jgi:hypothetical protein
VVVTGGNVKVLDFGLALMRQRHTTTGIENDDAVIGTLPYIAPEIFQGFGASELSDLYAAGLIDYEILTGHYPYDNSSMTKLLREILDTKPDFKILEDVLERDKVDPTRRLKTRNLLERLLHKNPKDRYQHVGTVLTEWHEIAGQAVPIETSAVRESYLQTAELIGRDVEMAQLGAMLLQLHDGDGSTWLIGGESGIGKSRLLDELRIQALVEGVMPLIPDIDRLLGYEVKDAPDIGAVASFNRFVVTITDLFNRQTEPLVVLLEDLQWSPESVEILKNLSAQTDHLPLLIIGTYRSDERPNLRQRPLHH